MQQVILIKTLIEQADFKDISRIYITNSSYGSIQKDGISRETKIAEIALTPRGISTIASSYYNKLLALDEFIYKPTLYREWREILKSWLQLEHFQHICDIVYFNKLIKEKQIEKYSVHISTQLSISCAFALAIFDRKRTKIRQEEQGILSELRTSINILRQKMDSNLNIVIKNLVANLIFEICLDSESMYELGE